MTGPSSGPSRPHLSVVIPVYNEEESVESLADEVRAACGGVAGTWEALFVDDGSRDRTFAVLERLHAADPRFKALRLRKNYGQTAAMAAGFRAARGRVIVSMDGDLQNDPHDIPHLLAKLDEGYDIVCGWRKNRKDKLISRKIPSRVANWIIGHMTGVPIHDNGCSLKAYRAAVVQGTALYSELHRFIPAMATLTGARIAEIVVNHRARQHGQSKYGLGRVWRVFLDIITVKMLTGFAARPAVWFSLLAAPALVLAVALLVAALIAGALHGSDESIVLVSTVGLLLFFLGTQLLSVGFLGELVLKTGDYRPGTAVRPTVRTHEGDDEHGQFRI